MEEVDLLKHRIKVIEEELDEKDMKDSDDKNNVSFRVWFVSHFICFIYILFDHNLF